jgi:hypothetical protein
MSDKNSDKRFEEIYKEGNLTGNRGPLFIQLEWICWGCYPVIR